MKEQILALESTDDLHTVRDKIARAQAGRLVLMWSALEQPLRRRLDLVLMKRWAAMAGSELAIISTDEEVRRLARRAGIPCHPNLTASALAGLSIHSDNSDGESAFRHARPLPIKPPRPGRLRPIPPALRIGLFSAAVLSVATVLLLLLPRQGCASYFRPADWSLRRRSIPRLATKSTCSSPYPTTGQPPEEFLRQRLMRGAPSP